MGSLMLRRRAMMAAANNEGNMVHLHTYTHADASWKDGANGNASAFVSAYAQDCTEDGLYIFVVTNNNITASANYAAVGAIKNVKVFGGRTDWLFQRQNSVSSNNTTNTWMLMNAGAIIDVYFISKSALVTT